ncbi:MAG: alpha/beta fold hydrolase [Bacteroidota bacterium]
MKKLFALLVLFITTSLFSQDISGPWHGMLTFPGGKLRLTINITKTDAGYTATMDSPDQKAVGIPITMVLFEENILAFAIQNAGLDYRGNYDGTGFKGTFTQNGNALPLDLGRDEVKVEKAKRPQEPVKPYPYYEEEVTFTNIKDNVTLAGTLTLPRQGGSNYPVVVLITGSGAQDRNEELLGHKPFLVLADYLTRNGIAVLRYDDRGTGASTGKFNGSTTQNFATDAAAAFTYLKTRKEINPKKIGLIGHSEGGTIAPMVAEANPDVAFIVLLAGTAIAGDELMMLQNYLLGKANGMPEEELTKLGAINRKIYNVIKEPLTKEQIKAKLQTVFASDLKPLFMSKGIPENEVMQYIDVQISELSSNWYSSFIKYDPAPALEKVKCPMLALNGSTDLQVAPKANLDAIKRAAQKSGNKKVTTKELPGLNHLFQASATGAPAEYGEIEETINPAALTEVLTWIKQQTK